MPLAPVHSRPRCIRSDQGLRQRGGLFPFWKLMRRRPQRQQQRGGWLSQSVVRIPGFDLRNGWHDDVDDGIKTHHDGVPLHLDEEDVKGKKWQKLLQLTLVPKGPSTRH